MPPHGLRPSLIAIAWSLIGPVAARAQPALTGAADVTLGGGRDTNMFLRAPSAIASGPGIRPGATSGQSTAAAPIAVGGWFVGARPGFGAALSAGGWRIESTYGLDFRRADATGNLVLHEVDLALQTPRLGPARTQIGLVAGRFDPGDFPGEAFSYVGAVGGIGVDLSDVVRVVAVYRGEIRTQDHVHGADLRLSYRPSPAFEAGAGMSYLRLAAAGAAAAQGASLQLVRPGLEVDVSWRRLGVAVLGWGGRIEESRTLSALQAGAAVRPRARLGEHVELVGSAEWVDSPWESADAPVRRYARRFAGLALVAQVSIRKALGPSGGSAGQAETRPLVEGDKVRLRLHAARAGSVVVVGSWDDWSARGHHLARTRERGLWEAWLVLPAGTHRYHFMVDGRAVRPPDAPRYVADDFGGQDAVLDVPGPSGTPR